MQNYWTSIFNVNGDSLPGPLIIGTFEKRAPGPEHPGITRNTPRQPGSPRNTPQYKN